jgi:hypothetical protein
VLAPKSKPAAVSSLPAEPPAKAADDKTTTSLRLERGLLAELKVLAVQQHCRVNDVILEAIRNHLELNGRKAA